MSVIELPTIILPPERWPEIEPIEREVFRDIMPPNPRQTTFLAAVRSRATGNGDIAGHLRIEHLHDYTTLYHFVHVYVKPEFRNHAGIALQLMTEAAECIPDGHSAVWLTRKPIPERLVRMLGAEARGPFYLYRRDS